MLVNTNEMFRKAYAEGYAVAAFNVDSVEILDAVIKGALKASSPVIIGVSERMLRSVPYLIETTLNAADRARIPVALHLDHGKSVEICKECVDLGFSSVMIDASKYDFEENIRQTREVVEYAHGRDVSVESELGIITGKEEDLDVSSRYGEFTRPDEAVEFIERSGTDSLAISIGTCHGAYKYKPGQKPFLRFDILKEISDAAPGFPIVLHGASSINQKMLSVFNEYGGCLPKAIGVPFDLIREASKMAVCKVNYASDLRLCYFAEMRRQLALHPDTYDSAKFFVPCRQAIEDCVYDTIINAVGSGGKA